MLEKLWGNFVALSELVLEATQDLASIGTLV